MSVLLWWRLPTGTGNNVADSDQTAAWMHPAHRLTPVVQLLQLLHRRLAQLHSSPCTPGAHRMNPNCNCPELFPIWAPITSSASCPNVLCPPECLQGPCWAHLFSSKLFLPSSLPDIVRILMGFQAKIPAPSWSPSLLPVRSEISSASGVPFLPTLPLLCLSLTFYYGKPHTHSKIGKTVQQTLVFQLPRFLRVNTRPVVFHLFSYQSLWSKSQILYHFIYKCFRMYLKGFF